MSIPTRSTCTFTTYDGSELAYHVRGEGEPLVCLLGGAMRASAYLGDLGGLSAGRRLIQLDLRGTGDSAIPRTRLRTASTTRSPTQRRCGSTWAWRGWTCSPTPPPETSPCSTPPSTGRPRRLAMVAPTCWAVDLAEPAKTRLADVRRRAGREPYDTAIAAYERALAALAAGGIPDEADWAASMPLAYGRWDETARAHAALSPVQKNAEAAAAFAAPGAFDPPATRAALRRVTAEVLVLAGELDSNPSPALAARLAELFPRGVVDVQRDGGHFPWLDDARLFAARVEGFLAAGA